MKRIVYISLLLSASMILGGCVRGSDSEEAATARESGRRAITDTYGRQVELPGTVTTIAAIGGAARIMTYAGCADKLVGVTDMDKKNVAAMPYTAVNAERFASLVSVGSGGSNDTPYIETLVELSPDVIIAYTSQDTVQNVAEKTGIPTVGIYPESMFDESFFSAIEIIGRVAGTREHCAAVIDYIKGCEADLERRTKDIDDAEKPTVYTGAVSFRGAHGFEGTYANYPPFVAIHGKNVTDETGEKGAFLVDLEKILVWDPDIIFLNPTNMHLVNEAYAKNKAFYEGLAAIQKGRVYSQISYNYNWTNMEIAIADAYYAGKVIYPEKFSDIDPVKKADEIFSVMLGEPFYEELASAGMAFGKIKIGE